MQVELGYKSLCSRRRKNCALLFFAFAILIFLGTLQSITMSGDLEFSRNQCGNYQATLGKIKITVQIFNENIYVDVRDYFAKEPGHPVDTPTKRGVTMTKEEWLQASSAANKTYHKLQQLYIDLNNGRTPCVPLLSDTQVFGGLTQSLQETKSGPQVILLKSSKHAVRASTIELTLHPWAWYNVFITASEKINNLIGLLEKEASIAAEQRKLNQLDWSNWMTEDDELFKATWDLPSLQAKDPSN